MTNEKTKIPVQLRIGRKTFVRFAICGIHGFWFLIPGITISRRQNGWMAVVGFLMFRLCLLHYEHGPEELPDNKATESTCSANSIRNNAEIRYNRPKPQHGCRKNKR